MSGADRTGRRGALCVAAAVFGAVLLAWALLPGRTGGVGTTIVVLLAGAWAVAAGLLWHGWWRRGGRRLAELDGPGRLLALMIATLPADRRDWGAAMAAELAHVEGAAARRRFAVGCARPALFPPARGRWRLPVTAGLAGPLVVAAWVAIDWIPQGGRLLLPTAVTLGGVAAVLAAARPRPADRCREWGLTGAAFAFIGLNAVMRFADGDSALARSLDAGPGAVMAVALVTAGWVLARGWPVGGVSRIANKWSEAGAIGLGFGLLTVAVVAAPAAPAWTACAPVVVCAAAGFGAARSAGSAQVGVTTAVWTAAGGMVLMFGALPLGDWAGGIGREVSGQWFLVVPDAAGLLWNIMLSPAVAAPFGLLGALAGSHLAAGSLLRLR